MRWRAIRRVGLPASAAFTVGGALGFGIARWIPPSPHRSEPPAAENHGGQPTAEADRGPTGSSHDLGGLPDPSSSLLYFPFTNATPSAAAKSAAIDVLRALSGETNACTAALTTYAQIEPVENFGGDYPSLRWTCSYLLADEAIRAKLRADGDARRFLALMEPNQWATLRNYIELRYEIGPTSRRITPEFKWLDEFMRFNSPGRAAWEHTDEVVAGMGPLAGLAIADVGAGSGFYTFRFADAVGQKGKVYAVELDPGHLNYLSHSRAESPHGNIEVVDGAPDAVGLPAGSVDVIFLCSTYQTIYGSIRHEERIRWIARVKAALRPGGRVVISENTPDGELGSALPYQGISISKSLVVAQWEAFGFHLIESQQFIPQRYLLTFEQGEDPVSVSGRVPAAARSLFMVPLPAPKTTEAGKAAGQLTKACVQARTDDACGAAVAAYVALEAKENFAGEYPSLRWISTYLTADTRSQTEMRADSPEGDRLIRAVEPDNFADVLTYIDNKYSSPATPMTRGRMEFHILDEILRYSSPERPAWEHTEALLDWMGVRSGQAVADIGAGPGFLTWRIADRLGKDGVIYASEVTKEHIAYLNSVVVDEGRSNVQVMQGMVDSTGLPPASVDILVLCHTYQAIYGVSSTADRAAFVASVRAALRPGGRVVVIESMPEDGLPAGAVPYNGFTLAPELVTAQLRGLGFRLLSERRFVPQRYALLFASN